MPLAATRQAEIPGIPGARYWTDSDLSPLTRLAVRTEARDHEEIARAGKTFDQLPARHFLALSGGGDDGAFGAGLLVGWTQHGTRPEFTLVSGVSAGALIAPFAFLGSRYDGVLRDICTKSGPDDIFAGRGLLRGSLSDGMMDHGPLQRLIARYVTAELLAEVAREYAKGRVLLIGTTNIDAGRPVVWDMGAIATAGGPRALSLFRQVLLASMAIPGAVSPVMIDVELHGRRYQEMHVDGGVMAQVFLYPVHEMEEIRRLGGAVVERKRIAYVIRNSRLDPYWAQTPRRTAEVARRAVRSLIQTQGFNDLQKISATAAKDGFDFNLAYIGADFDQPHPKEFDSTYMRQLFDYGYRAGAAGYEWRKSPPDL